MDRLASWRRCRAILICRWITRTRPWWYWATVKIGLIAIIDVKDFSAHRTVNNKAFKLVL